MFLTQSCWSDHSIMLAGYKRNPEEDQ
uniref:Uncharacterized protein n=1 Tax=Arundo donax TaxID=35708 RepID=A0A0A9AQD3_ARUDO